MLYGSETILLLFLKILGGELLAYAENALGKPKRQNKRLIN